jgi:hypothetical protein
MIFIDRMRPSLIMAIQTIRFPSTVQPVGGPVVAPLRSALAYPKVVSRTKEITKERQRAAKERTKERVSLLLRRGQEGGRGAELRVFFAPRARPLRLLPTLLPAPGAPTPTPRSGSPPPPPLLGQPSVPHLWSGGSPESPAGTAHQWVLDLQSAPAPPGFPSHLRLQDLLLPPPVRAILKQLFSRLGFCTGTPSSCRVRKPQRRICGLELALTQGPAAPRNSGPLFGTSGATATTIA